MEDNREVLLEVRHLHTSFFTQNGEVKAVNDVSFHLNKGEVIAIVGESGCGKSVTQMSIMQLVQDPPGKIINGEILFEGKNLLQYGKNSSEMRDVRGAQISMIFQEPMTSLNPVYTIGSQIMEVIQEHKKVGRKEARALAIQALEAVGIPDPERRMKNYPFELSGGMRQRVLIAIAVACRSKLIIADEPTTALDVTTQAQVMDLLLHVVQSQNTSMLIITHNLGLVTRYAERIYVMYAGKIVETGTTEQLLTNPKHPYTKGLLQSVPKLDGDRKKKLIPIEGAPPNLATLDDKCAFLPRCPYASHMCKCKESPVLSYTSEKEHLAACHLLKAEDKTHE